jgi:regulator of replication initiation timing
MDSGRGGLTREALLAHKRNAEFKTAEEQLAKVSPEILAEILGPLLQGDGAEFEHASAFWALFEIANKLHTTTAELGRLREVLGQYKGLSKDVESLRASEMQTRKERDRLAVEAQYLHERIREMQADVRTTLAAKETNKLLEHLLGEERARLRAWERTGWFRRLFGRQPRATKS